jgi:hypothetical protein
MTPFLLIVIFNLGMFLGFILHGLLQGAEEEVQQGHNWYPNGRAEYPVYRTAERVGPSQNRLTN